MQYSTKDFYQASEHKKRQGGIILEELYDKKNKYIEAMEESKSLDISFNNEELGPETKHAVDSIKSRIPQLIENELLLQILLTESKIKNIYNSIGFQNYIEEAKLENYIRCSDLKTKNNPLKSETEGYIETDDFSELINTLRQTILGGRVVSPRIGIDYYSSESNCTYITIHANGKNVLIFKDNGRVRLNDLLIRVIEFIIKKINIKSLSYKSGFNPSSWNNSMPHQFNIGKY